MPKILRIINRLNIGGPTFNVAYLTKYLAPEFETVLLSGMRSEKEGSSEHIIEELKIKPRYLTSMQREINFMDDWRSYWEIRKVIKEFKPDIVHTHMAKPGAVGRMAAIHENVPIILHTFHGHVFHSYFSPLKTKIFQLIEQVLASKTSGIVTISKLQHKELTEDFKITSAEKAFIIPLGFDLSKFQTNQNQKRMQFRTSYKLTESEIAIGIIGRLVPVKNHRLFLEAFSMAKKGSAVQLKAFIIGDGELRNELIQYCKELNLQIAMQGEDPTIADVIFTSWILNVDEPLAGLDIIALSSLNEGTPVSLIEAQAAGKPIVTTDVGGMKDVVIEGETALISPSGEVNSFANNLIKLSNSDTLMKYMSIKGPEHSLNTFSKDILIENMRNLYWKLINEKKI